MSKDQEQIDPQELLEKLDLKQFQGALFQAIAGILSGTEVETETVEVKLKIPKAIYDMINEVCKTFDQESAAVFTQMANDGLMGSMENVLNMGNSVDEEIKKEESAPAPEQQIPGLEGLTEKLSGFKDVAKQLETMQRFFENVQQPNIPNSPTKTKKDTK